MLRSYANLLLSVRRITQTNQGKATAGIDKEIVNTPEQRVILVSGWNGGNLKPTRRVEIPKPKIGYGNTFGVGLSVGIPTKIQNGYASVTLRPLKVIDGRSPVLQATDGAGIKNLSCIK
jgi:hypothetical protein